VLGGPDRPPRKLGPYEGHAASPSVIMGQLLSESPVTTKSKFVDEGDEREGKNLLLLVHVDDTCRRPRRRAKPWTAAQRPRCAPRRARAPPAPPRQDVNSLDPSLASRMSQLARAPIDTPNCPPLRLAGARWRGFSWAEGVLGSRRAVPSVSGSLPSQVKPNSICPASENRSFLRGRIGLAG
jgi:hypothetical protein